MISFACAVGASVAPEGRGNGKGVTNGVSAQECFGAKVVSMCLHCRYGRTIMKTTIQKWGEQSCGAHTEGVRQGVARCARNTKRQSHFPSTTERSSSIRTRRLSTDWKICSAASARETIMQRSGRALRSAGRCGDGRPQVLNKVGPCLIPERAAAPNRQMPGMLINLHERGREQ